jgi:acetyl-CoA carboxylase biotin carboxyl carrier protein
MATKKNPPQSARAVSPAQGNPNIETLSSILGLFKDSGLHELEFEDGGLHVRLTRNATTTVTVGEPSRAPSLAAAYTAAPAAPVQPAAAPHTHVPGPHAKAEEITGGHVITSPFVGTFYRAPNPTAAPFVQVGTLVKKGQTLCIIEAMKLMNEIEADEGGKVAEILAENAQAVEFGQKLFRIVPA